MSKTALITGINGMDGSHLADFLLDKNYTIYCLERRSSSINRTNTNHLLDKVNFITGDLTDQNSLFRALKEDSLKEIISKHYGIRNPNVFENHIRNIINIRNICAHNGVLFDYRSPKGIKNIPGLDINDRNRNSLEGVLKLVTFYIEKISVNRKNDFISEIEKLKSELNTNLAVKGIIAENIGL